MNQPDYEEARNHHRGRLGKMIKSVAEDKDEESTKTKSRFYL
jgi:hypothetical protein